MLTPDEILRLPAGRDLDAVVAELRGWECWHKQNNFCDGEHLSKCMACGGRGHGNCFGNGMGPVQVPCCRDMPNWSGSWEDAGPLLEEMLAAGYQLTFAPLGPCGVYKFVCWLKKDGVLPFEEIRVHTAQEGTAKAYAIWRLQQQEGLME